jgi:hypothetical protein
LPVTVPEIACSIVILRPFEIALRSLAASTRIGFVRRVGFRP